MDFLILVVLVIKLALLVDSGYSISKARAILVSFSSSILIQVIISTFGYM